MKLTKDKKNTTITRRKFLGSSAALMSGFLLSPLSVSQSDFAAGSDTLKLALIGSGARGTGAVVNALRADKGVELVAMADVFEEIVNDSHENLMRIDDLRDRIRVPDNQKFVGLDAYKKAIRLADVVILATPPAFRPLHFETAINEGKHVFMEKPMATDAPGIRRMLSAGKKADKKGLSVVAGLQNRYAQRVQQTMREIRNGRIGDVTSMSCNYLIAGIKQVPRKEGDNEMEYQLRNWRMFEWLWGGSPAGLTIHFEDIVHWAKDSFPVRAFGTGGRMSFDGPAQGNIYDNYYIDYEYEDGTHLHSRTRHIQNCWTNRSIEFKGSAGSINLPAFGEIEAKNLKGKTLWSYNDSEEPNPYVVEQEVFYQSIRNDQPVNDTERATKSTMTSIMGRMAVQSGKLVEWDEALNSDLVLVPDNLTFDSTPPAVPMENGHYPVPVPGGDIRIL